MKLEEKTYVRSEKYHGNKVKKHINIEHKESSGCSEDMIKFSRKCENYFKRMGGINAIIVK